MRACLVAGRKSWNVDGVYECDFCMLFGEFCDRSLCEETDARAGESCESGK